MTRKLGVGVIGAGVISHAYLRTICNAPELDLVAVSSLGMASAEAQAQRYGCAAKTTDELLADPAIDLVVNLAPPAAHYDLGCSVLNADKHLYTEKPFATSLEDARSLMALALERGLKLGAAPDTFLGPAHQEARRLVDSGVIGRIVGGAAVMASAGMEHWHPNPAFFYSKGGGPLLDIGPYMVTLLVNLLGRVAAVEALGTKPKDIRTIRSRQRNGQTIHVDVPTTVNGALLFESGANISLTLSWDVIAHRRAAIELYGEEGTMILPTPNGFDGDIEINSGTGWSTVYRAPPPPVAAISDLPAAIEAMEKGTDPMTGGSLGPKSPPLFGDLRGLGVVDLALAVREGREPHASAKTAMHVLDVLLGLEASASKRHRIRFS